jgi:hypothetical protein
MGIWCDIMGNVYVWISTMGRYDGRSGLLYVQIMPDVFPESLIIFILLDKQVFFIQILSAIDAPRMQRLDQPDACPIEYYNLMLQCWEHDPNRRPKFIDIARNLSEMQPDRVRTICACRDGQLDHLQYDKGDVITVLDKRYGNNFCDYIRHIYRPKEYPDGYFWRGIVKCGRTGLFLPGNTVAQISVEYPSCNLPSSTVSGMLQIGTPFIW